MEYLAHRDPATGREQPMTEHLERVAELAAAFAEGFGAAECARLCGMLHDIGKYSDKFQRRIRGGPEQTDHATAGALEARRLGNVPAAFAIAGHHGGLPDGGSQRSDTPEDGTFLGKMKRAPGRGIEDYGAFRQEIRVESAPIPADFVRDSERAFFFIRMLFSCLVDADWLDTEAFLSGGAVERRSGESLTVLEKRLRDYTARWARPERELDRKRWEMLQAAEAGGARPRGFFTLTVPTGGGKTTASVAFALRHALAHGLKRVIYVIPYTSILEQTQGVFEEIFGAENVVAHYAGADYPAGEEKGETDRRYLAAENWDAPILLTTAVQFFESLYANRPYRCRKLHNIAGSVLIFDEAQMLPPAYLRPCVAAMARLTEDYGCSAVLCTATQPSLEPLLREFCRAYRARELCPDAAGMYEAFRRVTYRQAGVLSDEALAGRLSQEEQALCVVGSRAQAQAVFALLEPKGRFHLSTLMYPAHRRRTLVEIRRRLEYGLPCRVVSTSLIEAGVDVDFPTVYRALAGLDSLLQAGGRCNREGRHSREESVVYIFESDRPKPRGMEQNLAAAQRVLREFEDISDPAAVEAYFRLLYYTLKGDAALDAKGILPEIRSGSMPFEAVAERFKLIEGMEHTVYIPLDEGAKLYQALERQGPSRALLRRLGQYAVGVYPEHFQRLTAMGAARALTEHTAVLRDLSLYSEHTGLSFRVNEGAEFII